MTLFTKLVLVISLISCGNSEFDGSKKTPISNEPEKSKQQDAQNEEATKKEEKKDSPPENIVENKSPLPNPNSTPAKEIGFHFETLNSPAVIQSVTFEKNGEIKTFKVIDSKRWIQEPFKIYTKVSGKWEDFTNKEIIVLNPGDDPKPCWGGGTWSTKWDYIFTTRFGNYPNHQPLTGKLTLFWPATSEMGQWIQGSKVKYRFRSMSWNGKATIKLIGLTQETSKVDVQTLIPNQSGVVYKETDLGIFPQ